MKYIIRLYDSELDKQVQESYQKQKDQFPSMNAYLTELIRVGLNSPVRNSNDNTEQLLETAINTLIVGFEKQKKRQRHYYSSAIVYLCLSSCQK